MNFFLEIELKFLLKPIEIELKVPSKSIEGRLRFLLKSIEIELKIHLKIS